MSDYNALSIINTVETGEIAQQLKGIKQFQSIVNQTLSSDSDYGVIGGSKPTLLKAGAEKILMLLGLSSRYEILEKIEDYDRGIFAYTVKCSLLKGDNLITEGLGSCNSKEDKYRYRWAWPNEIPNHIDKETLVSKGSGKGLKYRIDNDEIFSLVNTLLKMAKKRAQIDATLTVAALSNVFTQDLEDIKQYAEEERMQTMTSEEAADYKITFGKHKGKTIGEILQEDSQYLDWMLTNDRTDDNLKKIIKQVMDASLSEPQIEPESNVKAKTGNRSKKAEKTQTEPQSSPEWQDMIPVDDGDVPF